MLIVIDQRLYICPHGKHLEGGIIWVDGRYGGSLYNKGLCGRFLVFCVEDLKTEIIFMRMGVELSWKLNESEILLLRMFMVKWDRTVAKKRIEEGF